MINKLKGEISLASSSLKERLFLYYKAQKDATENKYCNVCDYYVYDETQSIGVVPCAYKGDCKLGHVVTVLFEEKSHICEDWVVSK